MDEIKVLDKRHSTEEPEEGVLESQDALPTENEAPEPTEDELESIDFRDLAVQLAIAITNVYRSQNEVVFVVVNDRLHELFCQAFKSLPDEAFDLPFPASAIKENLPIYANPEIPRIRVVTATDLEVDFLHRHFTSNGTLQKLLHYIQSTQVTLSPVPGAQLVTNIPIRLTLDSLRTMYLLELKERLVPKIVVPEAGVGRTKR